MVDHIYIVEIEILFSNNASFYDIPLALKQKPRKSKILKDIIILPYTIPVCFSQVILFELLFAIILAISSNTCKIRYMYTWLSENDHNTFFHYKFKNDKYFTSEQKKNDNYVYQRLDVIPVLSCICSELFKTL